MLNSCQNTRKVCTTTYRGLKDQLNACIFLFDLVPDWYYVCIFGELALQNCSSYFEPDTLSYHFCLRVHLYHGLANANANMGAVDCPSHWSASAFIPRSPIGDTDALLAQLLFTWYPSVCDWAQRWSDPDLTKQG